MSYSKDMSVILYMALVFGELIISKLRGMMNLFPHVSAIALSWVFVASLLPAFIFNLMQFIVHPSVEMMP